MKFFVAFSALVAVAVADVSHLTEAGAQIIKQESDVSAVGYQNSYETSNGISGENSGALKQISNDAAAVVSQGGYAYTSPEGVQIVLKYIADEFGFHPEGAHLPTTPPPQPIPDYILRSLDFIAKNPPQPESPKFKN